MSEEIKQETEETKKGVKLLILGTAGSGKTTLLKTLKDALVFSYDNKDFPIKSSDIICRNMHHKKNGGTITTGSDFVDRISNLLDAYEAKKGTPPKTIVIDSISTVAGSINTYCNDKYEGFKQWGEYSKNIQTINNVLTNLASKGINIILVSHAQYNIQNDKWEDTTKGSFNKTEGGFFSTVDYSIFIEATKSDERIVHLKNSYKLARTALTDLKDEEKKVKANDFSLQQYLERIEKHNLEASQYEI